MRMSRSSDPRVARNETHQEKTSRATWTKSGETLCPEEAIGAVVDIARLSLRFSGGPMGATCESLIVFRHQQSYWTEKDMGRRRRRMQRSCSSR